MVYHQFQKSLTAFFGFCGVLLVLINFFFGEVVFWGFFWGGVVFASKKWSTRKLKIAMALADTEFEELRL